MGKALEPAPPGGKPREARTRVSLSVRIKTDGGWVDGTALNVSTKGIMLRTAAPIGSSSYVEIRRGTQVAMIGRVVWSKGSTIGLKTQDRIDIPQLLNSTRDRAADASGARERRTAIRPDPAELVTRSRHWASIGQYAVMISAGGFAAYLAASGVHDLLSGVFGHVTTALAG